MKKVVGANWKKKKSLWVCTNPKRAFKLKKKIEVSSLWTPQEINEAARTSPQRQDIETLPADEPDSKLIGWTVTEKIGIAVTNPHAVTRRSVIGISDCNSCEHWNNKKKKCKVKPRDCKWEPNEEYRIEQKGW